jgi:hypothetical protein
MGGTETQGAFADLVPRSSEKRRARQDDIYEGPYDTTPTRSVGRGTAVRGSTAPRARTSQPRGRGSATIGGRVQKPAARGRGRGDSMTVAAPKAKPGHPAEACSPSCI